MVVSEILKNQVQMLINHVMLHFILVSFYVHFILVLLFVQPCYPYLRQLKTLICVVLPFFFNTFLLGLLPSAGL